MTVKNAHSRKERRSNSSAKSVREAFGFNQTEMSDLMGVNFTTWYRWEQSEASPMDPFHQKLIAYTAHTLAEMDEGQREAWIKSIKTNLSIGGTLRGLAALLEE